MEQQENMNSQEFIDSIDTDIDAQKAITPPRMEHPRAILFFLKQVEADNEIIHLIEKEYAYDMYCFDKVKDIPRLPKNYHEEIKIDLETANFDYEKDWICIISPFVSMYRGFIVEVLTIEDAEKYIKALTAQQLEIKVHGWGKQFAKSKVEKLITTGSGSTDAEIRKHISATNMGRVML